MKRLILVRHAKSSWSNDALADFERPLSARGERDAPRMGARLRNRGLRPDLILASPATRAQRTAQLVAHALECPADAIRLEPALYLATPAEILTVIGTQAAAVDQLLVVGHNPGMTELVNLLLPTLGLANLPTAGVVVIDCATPRWSDVNAARRDLAYYDYPKNPAGEA
ncbi:MAG TPA: histidine phosphatase family protein [Gammaproteobacteria bacterium]|jgi:phosphohistidine phosphatase|nr:histidine phosphatase family protein [Gammaproteobacteria bacterium]